MNQYLLFLSRVIATYTNDIELVLNNEILNIFTKFHQLLSFESSVTPLSDEERDYTILKREFYNLLQTITTQQLTPIFISQTNIGNLYDILNTLIQGCTIYKDPSSQKHCFSIWNNLVVQWLSPLTSQNLPEGFSDTLINLILENLIPLNFEIPIDPRFNLEDAKSNEVIQEMAILERNLWSFFGDSFETFLTQFLKHSTLHFTKENISQYIIALKTSDSLKQWRKFKRQYFAFLKIKN